MELNRDTLNWLNDYHALHLEKWPEAERLHLRTYAENLLIEFLEQTEQFSYMLESDRD